MGKHNSERTSRRVASVASRVLRNPKSATLADRKTLAASALTQAPDRRKPSRSRRGR